MAGYDIEDSGVAGSAEAPEPMDDRELISLLEQYKERALNRDEEEISNARQRAYDYYRMEPYGDEQEGYSQAVTGEVLEVVEWALPSLLRVFLTGDPVEFKPQGDNDVDRARQETAAINWVIRQNDAYNQFSQWFRDALLYPNAYLKVWWDKREEYSFEEYSGLDEEQVQGLHLDRSIEVSRVKQAEDGSLSVVLRAGHTESRIRLAATAPEEVLVDGHCTDTNLDEANYVAHRPSHVTRSDLVAMGYDLDTVLSLEQWDGDLSSTEKTARRDTIDENSGLFTPSGDTMMEEVEYVEAYVKADADGDGYAERRKVCYSGTTMLENKHQSGQPFCTLTCLIQPHRHIGLSIGETAMPIMRENSALKRQGLDNLYRTNRPRAILGRSIDRDEFDNYQPHGGVGGDPKDYAPEQVQVSVQHILPWMQYQDDQLQARTGVSKHAMGLDADTLAQSTMGAYLEAAGASSQRMEALIRTFAETGMAQLAQKVHRLMRAHQDIPLQMQLSGGKWVSINPREWAERKDVRPCVGIGNGSVRERAASALQILEQQKEAVQVGLSTKKRIYNSLDELVQLLGRSGAERYFVDPESDEGQQIAQAQAQQAQEQAQAQQAAMQEQFDIAREQIRSDYQQQVMKISEDFQKFLEDNQRQWAELEMKYQTDVPARGVDAGVLRGIPGGGA